MGRSGAKKRRGPTDAIDATRAPAEVPDGSTPSPRQGKTNVPNNYPSSLEDAEDLLHVERLVHRRLVREHVEAHRLRQRPALAHGDDVALLDVLEAGRDVDRHVLMSLLETACVQ